MRGVGENLKGVLDAISNPFKDFGTLWKFGKSQIEARLSTPEIPLHNPASLQDEAGELARRIRDFGLAVQNTLAAFRKSGLKNKSAGMSDELAIMQQVLKSQYQQERIADAACDLYASSCTLSRLDSLLNSTNHDQVERDRQIAAGRYFLRLANRRVKQSLAALSDHDDDAATAAAEMALGRS